MEAEPQAAALRLGSILRRAADGLGQGLLHGQGEFIGDLGHGPELSGVGPEMVKIAKGLRRRKRGNLRAIAAELADAVISTSMGRSSQRPRWPQCWGA
jgi:hypothetical protein